MTAGRTLSLLVWILAMLGCVRLVEAQEVQEAAGTMDAAGKHVEPLGFKEHPMRVGDGLGGFSLGGAEVQFLHYPGAEHLMPFGIQYMDNGELILIASAEKPGEFTPVVAFSKDDGDTWSDWLAVPEASGRPMMLTYLGQGKVTFHTAERFTSTDYGRTWQKAAMAWPQPEDRLEVEGNAQVDRDAQGLATRIAAVGYKHSDIGRWPENFTGFIQWSADGGLTWDAGVKPPQWGYDFEYRGEKVTRGVSEGSVVRAANGDLVAALRVDMPPLYYKEGAQGGVDFDDSLEGLGVSLSTDDGKTWSPITLLFEAGRHHPNLLLLPNGDIVMTYIVRVDVREGKLAGYRRGCEGLVSHDNGRTWDTSRRYVLDEFEFYDGVKWFNGETGHLGSAALPDGRILTAYGRYQAKSTCLIRWRP